jgi:hypothetical protein
MEIKSLTRENFLLYAMSNYTNSDCMGISEFTDDLAKMKYVKRLLKKYTRSKEIRPILLLNHLVVLGNIFGPYPTSRMLFYKLESEIHSPLKTVLLYLNYIEDTMFFDDIYIENIPMDQRLADILKKTINEQ